MPVPKPKPDPYAEAVLAAFDRLSAADPEPRGRTKCRICNGRGYIRCDCWPADCICGFDDDFCEACDGEGWLDDDEDDWP
ncbi:MAG TPA: hypothetical protein PKD10_16130 [Paracoccaceae bacterium]|nr:hypothetical protein [Paracoccaceae bacterium]HMO73629.1 hypothetical protein [Paracoccaceae bacterium]